ncbi:MAG: hypothetical protein PVJ49_01785 [Acidobacteriota bacterium]
MPSFALAIAAACGLSLLAYAPVAGAGFQSDDFRWLWHARIGGWVDVGRIFTETLGFYRPFTQLLWSFDLWRAGGDPFAFFVTNFALHLLVLVLFAFFARRLLADPAAAGAAVMLAALSHHTNNMAVIWISGRGALLGSAAALAALWLWDRWCRQEAGVVAWLGACAATAVGLGAYEAVVGVPLLMALMIPYRGGGRRPMISAMGPLALWAPYLVMRLAVGARQPWSAGEGYSYRLAAVLPNLAEYLGRALAVAAVLFAVVLIAALAARCGASVARAARDGARPVAAFGIAWFLIGLLPALPVVARSNLYVYFAALGLDLVAGATLVSAWRRLHRERRSAARVVVVVTTLAVLLLWPPFAWSRNGRLAGQARLAMSAIADMRQAVPRPGDGECIALVDDEAHRPNLHGAFAGDLYWLGAYVYDEEPSYRVRYAGGDRGAPCDRPHLMRLAPGDDGVVLR